MVFFWTFILIFWFFKSAQKPKSFTFNSYPSSFVFVLLGVGDICPIGSFCPPGSKSPENCPPGSYQDEVGRTMCKDCPEGYYCYTNTSDYSAFECPKGHFCPVNTTRPLKHPCWPGTYNPTKGLSNQTACLLCDAGSYCQGFGNEVPTDFCTEGYYCPLGTVNVTLPCPVGSFCPNASKEPTKCTGGHFCPVQKIALPRYECKEGYYCTLEAIRADPTGGLTGDICPTGSYCPRGSVSPTPCPIGTYLNSTENV